MICELIGIVIWGKKKGKQKRKEGGVGKGIRRGKENGQKVQLLLEMSTAIKRIG